MADLRKDFWIRETGTGQQVAQLQDKYMMMMMLNRGSGEYVPKTCNKLISVLETNEGLK